MQQMQDVKQMYLMSMSLLQTLIGMYFLHFIDKETIVDKGMR